MAGEANKNFYDLLGVLPSASMAELKRAYREKARTFHPDLNPSEETQAQFRFIQEAYNLLRDPVERTFYDRGLGFKSNWVDEVAKAAERKKTQDRVRRAQAATGEGSPEPEPTPTGRRRPPTTEPAPDPDEGPAPQAKGPTGEPPPPPPPPSDPPGGGAPAGSAGRSWRRGRGFGGASRASERRRGFADAASQGPSRSYGARSFSKAESRPTAAPSAASPERPMPQKVVWYRDRALRIFLFGANSLAALVLFFTAPSRGIYFLVLAFGVEILYRLSELPHRLPRDEP